MPPLAPPALRLTPDDCITELTINGKAVPKNIFSKACDAQVGVDMDLSGYLRPRANVVVAKIQDNGVVGGLGIAASHSTPIYLLLVFFLASLWACLGYMFLRQYSWSLPIPLCAVFMVGLYLRVFYTLDTSVFQRAHDAWGHYDYVMYVLRNWSVPAADKGWEFYQPPLYYFVSAVWAKAGIILGMSEGAAVLSVQRLSVLLSIGTLALSAVMCMMAFPKKPWLQAMALMLPAFLPGLVMQASRVNNDVGLLFLSTCTILCLFGWWKTHRTWWWLCTAGFTGLAVLTKSNALALLVPVGLCLLWQRSAWTTKIIQGVRAAAVFVLFTGWFQIPKFFTSKSVSLFLVQNLVTLNGGLRVQNSVANFLFFNPVAILWHPFNNPWSDIERRGRFLEYLFRSAFFGEFNFGDPFRLLAQQLLLIGFAVVTAALWGMWRDAHGKKSLLPLTLTIGGFLLCHMAFRYVSPFSTSQDFRYVTSMVPALGIVATAGVDLLPRSWKNVFCTVMVIFAAEASFLLLSVSGFLH